MKPSTIILFSALLLAGPEVAQATHPESSLSTPARKLLAGMGGALVPDYCNKKARIQEMRRTLNSGLKHEFVTVENLGQPEIKATMKETGKYIIHQCKKAKGQ